MYYIQEDDCIYEELVKYANDRLCDIQMIAEQIVTLHNPTLDDQHNATVKQVYHYYSEWSRIKQLRYIYAGGTV
jgi:hypothetical protein